MKRRAKMNGLTVDAEFAGTTPAGSHAYAIQVSNEDGRLLDPINILMPYRSTDKALRTGLGFLVGYKAAALRPYRETLVAMSQEHPA